VRIVRTEVWRQESWLLLHDNASPKTSFSPRNFDHIQHDCRPPPYFSDSLIGDKAKGSHFVTIEMMDSKLQAVLNTLSEHDFQDAFDEWQKSWERCIREEGDYFKSDGGQYA
jgi:hypothetical protein